MPDRIPLGRIPRTAPDLAFRRLLSLTAIFVSWEHIQVKVTDVNGASVARSWGGLTSGSNCVPSSSDARRPPPGSFGLFSSRECGPQPVAGVSWVITSCHHYYTPTSGFTTDAGFRETATALASATLACAVLAGAVNLWGAFVLFEAMAAGGGVDPRRKAAAAAGVTAAWTQGASLILALLGVALFGRRLYTDRAHYSDSDVRGDAGYALTVALFFANLGLLLRQGAGAAAEARRRRESAEDAAAAAPPAAPPAAAAALPASQGRGGDGRAGAAAAAGGSPAALLGRHRGGGGGDSAALSPLQPPPETAAPPGSAVGEAPPAPPV